MTATRLCDLPTELLIRTLELLDSRDIINIRATCRTLAAVTRERIVWSTTLQKIRQSHGISDTSFYTSKQSISSSELEFLAVRPRAFVHQVRTAQDELTPKVHQTLDFNPLKFTDIPDHEEYKGFIDVMLLPGGRYLLTNYKFRSINLWDLGVFSNSVQERPIISLEHWIDPVRWMLCLEEASASPDGKSLRFIVHTIPEEETDPGLVNELSAYEITFGEQPSCALLARLSPIDYSDLRAFTGELFAFCHQEYTKLSVWNVEADSLITWELEGRELDEIVLSESHCLLLSVASFDILSIEIPDDQLRNARGQRIDGGPLPNQRLRIDRSSNTPPGVLNSWDAGPCTLYKPFRWQGSSKPIHFAQFFQPGLADRPGVGSGHINVYTVSTTPPSINGHSTHDQDEDENPPLYIRHLVPLISEAEVVGGLWGYFCEDAYVLLWAEQPELNSSTLPRLMISASDHVNMNSSDTVGQKSIVLFRDDGGELDEEAISDFCPISARLVHMDHGKLHLYEYCPLTPR